MLPSDRLIDKRHGVPGDAQNKPGRYRVCTWSNTPRHPRGRPPGWPPLPLQLIKKARRSRKKKPVCRGEKNQTPFPENNAPVLRPCCEKAQHCQRWFVASPHSIFLDERRYVAGRLLGGIVVVRAAELVRGAAYPAEVWRRGAVAPCVPAPEMQPWSCSPALMSDL